MGIGARVGMRVSTWSLDAGMLLDSTHVLLGETTSRKRTKQNKLANPSAGLKETGVDKIVTLAVQGPALTIAQEHHPILPACACEWEVCE